MWHVHVHRLDECQTRSSNQTNMCYTAAAPCRSSSDECYVAVCWLRVMMRTAIHHRAKGVINYKRICNVGKPIEPPAGSIIYGRANKVDCFAFALQWGISNIYQPHMINRSTCIRCWWRTFPESCKIERRLRQSVAISSDWIVRCSCTCVWIITCCVSL